MIPRFCMQTRITDREATPCSVEHLLEVMSSPEVQSVCDEIRLLQTEWTSATGGAPAEELSRLKRQLPVITPHAQAFTANERKNSQAIPSGLVMLDLDHVDDPRSLFASFSDEELHACQVCFAAITPSGHGLRLIAERLRGESILDAQQRLADALHLPAFDPSTKDLARASFVVPRSYLLYIDPSGLEFPNREQADLIAGCFVNCQAIVSPSQPAVPLQEEPTEEASFQPEFPLSYKGIPYTEIISQLVMLLGGTPTQGERNTFFFTLVRYARYICDFNPAFVLHVLPDFGLSLSERQQVIASAINRPRKSDLPDIINRAITLAQVEFENTQETPNNQDTTTPLEMPKLPRVLELICKRLPEPFRPAMVIAALPVLGTLATRVRFDYLDHQEHSFSFMSCVTAPAATGKSFIRRPINLLLTPIDEQDEVEREKEQDYKDRLRAAKNAKVQPENPRACPRNNGINISIAKLLQLLSYSEGKHLIGIGEEIDTLVKSEKAGVWSQKSDIYRLGFDNAKYGQNYMSDNSFSANVPVYYNLLLTGTPGGMYRFFRDVEDGLMTRFAFAQLPDMFGTDIPDFQPYTATEEAEIIRIARHLDMAAGKISCSAVNDAILQWLDLKKQQAIANDSRAIDTLRRRAAVIGFRAGYLAALLNGAAKHTNRNSSSKASASKTSKRLTTSSLLPATSKDESAAAFAAWVAEYVFLNQMALFGDKVESASNEWLSSQSAKGSVRGLLAKLPQTFTKSELMTLRVRNGQSSDVRTVISRWLASGMIRMTDKNTYTKIAANCV